MLGMSDVRLEFVEFYFPVVVNVASFEQRPQITKKMEAPLWKQTPGSACGFRVEHCLTD
jgi:hypothetical protein